MAGRRKRQSFTDDLAGLIVLFIRWLISKVTGKPFRQGGGQESQTEEAIFDHAFSKRPFFTKREIVLFRMLEEIARSKRLYVFAKVRLFDLVETAKVVSRDERFWQNNKINQMHLDFVLVDSSSLKPVCAIELDDSSHSGEKAQYRDRKKDEALASAEIVLLRVPPGFFAIDQIKSMLQGI